MRCRHLGTSALVHASLQPWRPRWKTKRSASDHAHVPPGRASKQFVRIYRFVKVLLDVVGLFAMTMPNVMRDMNSTIKTQATMAQQCFSCARRSRASVCTSQASQCVCGFGRKTLAMVCAMLSGWGGAGLGAPWWCASCSTWSSCATAAYWGSVRSSASALEMQEGCGEAYA